MSVPQAVKEIIISNDLYFKSVKSGIANYTAIANKIQKEVESITGTHVNIGTIVVAIKRFADLVNKSDSINKYPTSNNQKSLMYDDLSDPNLLISPQDARMKLTGSIIDIDLDDQNEFKRVNDLLDEYTRETIFDYNLIRTTEKIRIVTEDMFNSRKIITSLSEKCNGKITEGLSKITITLIYDNIIAIRQLLFNIFFTSNEIVLVLERKEAIRTYDLLQKKIFKS